MPEKKSLAKKSAASSERSGASKEIQARLRVPGGWRSETLARVRGLVMQAAPDMVEEIKWRKPSNPDGVIAWSNSGLVCTGETYKDKVKLTFMHGAALNDPEGLFNAGFGGGTRRAIDIHEGETIDAGAFKDLVKAAVAKNRPTAKSARGTKAMTDKNAHAKMARSGAAKAKTVKLLSGGNPQIAKAEGDAPVQTYIAAAPGWKSDAARRLDTLIERTVPGVRKAVKWNSPFYGVEGQGWFLAFHCFTKYIKVTFFKGASLDPLPPVESKDANTRYIHIHENEKLDEKLLASWIRQAAKLPGWMA
ncbi:DUF1801 domain-containing protein [bacterium]|nr:DUF1801 domain-containing protein [bacterium]